MLVHVQKHYQVIFCAVLVGEHTLFITYKLRLTLISCWKESAMYRSTLVLGGQQIEGQSRGVCV